MHSLGSFSIKEERTLTYHSDHFLSGGSSLHRSYQGNRHPTSLHTNKRPSIDAPAPRSRRGTFIAPLSLEMISSLSSDEEYEGDGEEDPLAHCAYDVTNTFSKRIDGSMVLERPTAVTTATTPSPPLPIVDLHRSIKRNTNSPLYQRQEEEGAMDSEEEYRLMYAQEEEEIRNDLLLKPTHHPAQERNGQQEERGGSGSGGRRPPLSAVHKSYSPPSIPCMPPLRSARKASDSYPLIDHNCVVYPTDDRSAPRGDHRGAKTPSHTPDHAAHRRTVSFHFNNIQKNCLEEMKKLLFDTTEHNCRYVVNRCTNLSDPLSMNNNPCDRDYRDTFLCGDCQDSSSEGEEEDESEEEGFTEGKEGGEEVSCLLPRLPSPLRLASKKKRGGLFAGTNSSKKGNREEEIMIIKAVPLVFATLSPHEESNTPTNQNNKNKNVSPFTALKHFIEKEILHPSLIDRLDVSNDSKKRREDESKSVYTSLPKNKYIGSVMDVISLGKTIEDGMALKAIGRDSLHSEKRTNLGETLKEKMWINLPENTGGLLNNINNNNNNNNNSNNNNTSCPVVFNNSIFLCVREYISNGVSLPEYFNEETRVDPSNTVMIHNSSNNTKTNQNGFQNMDDFADIIWQLVNCLLYLQQKSERMAGVVEKGNEDGNAKKNAFHGNLKPSNVFFLPQTKRVKLTDPFLPSFSVCYFDLNQNNEDTNNNNNNVKQRIDLNGRNVILLRSNAKKANRSGSKSIRTSGRSEDISTSMKERRRWGDSTVTLPKKKVKRGPLLLEDYKIINKNETVFYKICDTEMEGEEKRGRRRGGVEEDADDDEEIHSSASRYRDDFNRYFVAPECFIQVRGGGDTAVPHNDDFNGGRDRTPQLSQWYTETKKTSLSDIYSLGVVLFYIAMQTAGSEKETQKKKWRPRNEKNSISSQFRCSMALLPPPPCFYTATPILLSTLSEVGKGETNDTVRPSYLLLEHADMDHSRENHNNDFYQFVERQLLKYSVNRHLADMILRCIQLNPKKRFINLLEIKKNSLFRVFGMKKYELQKRYNEKQKEKRSQLTKLNYTHSSGGHPYRTESNSVSVSTLPRRHTGEILSSHSRAPPAAQTTVIHQRGLQRPSPTPLLSSSAIHPYRVGGETRRGHTTTTTAPPRHPTKPKLISTRVLESVDGGRRTGRGTLNNSSNTTTRPLLPPRPATNLNMSLSSYDRPPTNLFSKMENTNNNNNVNHNNKSNNDAFDRMNRSAFNGIFSLSYFDVSESRNTG